MSTYMNKRSQPDNQGVEKIVMVSVYDIDPHPQNKYSMKDLETLAAQIEIQGRVTAPLILKKNEKGRYTIISGHRRRAATLMLLENKSEKITSPAVPSIIREYQNEEEEIFALAAANSQREKTLEDKENEIEMMFPLVKTKYEEAKASGERLGKFRRYFAEKLGISSSDLQRIKSLKKLAPELREEINKGNLDITPASTLTNLSHDEQREIYHEAQEQHGKVTGKAIQTVKQSRIPEVQQESYNEDQLKLIEEEILEEEQQNNQVDLIIESYEKENDYIESKDEEIIVPEEPQGKKTTIIPQKHYEISDKNKENHIINNEIEEIDSDKNAVSYVSKVLNNEISTLLAILENTKEKDIVQKKIEVFRYLQKSLEDIFQ